MYNHMPRKRTQSVIDKAWVEFDKVFNNPEYIPSEGLTHEDLYALRNGWSDRLEKLWELVPEPEEFDDHMPFTAHGVVMNNGKYEVVGTDSAKAMQAFISPAYADVWFADRILSLLTHVQDKEYQLSFLELLNSIL